ncbi:hypothetical protein [Burkholderia sp. Leaf177]|nr:hypothetical protein [Burkholderia sp. Leaf177]
MAVSRVAVRATSDAPASPVEEPLPDTRGLIVVESLEDHRF